MSADVEDATASIADKSDKDDAESSNNNNSGNNKALKKKSLDDVIDRRWGERASAMTAVRMKLRSGWRNDDDVLEQYFQAVDNNWKLYTGPRTPKQTVKLQGLYRQATMGDCPDEAQFLMDEEKFVSWKKLRGTPKEMAKRRYITYLAEINPLLIDVMPDEKPPDGFPLDRQGHLICAKCNTVVGCARPLLDNHNTDLRQQLFEREELHEPDTLKAWVKNALKMQRCIWGIHMPISKAQSREFVHWFEKPDNKGFHAYDSTPLMQMIRELIVYHHEVAYDMMQNKSEYSIEDYNDQATRAIKLRDVYMQLSGESFVFEVPCQRDTHMCNEQRKADGGKNHVHPVEIDPPSRMEVASFKEAIELRQQCQQLGLNPVTGVCLDIEKRCQIYRDRIAEHFRAMEAAAVAKRRNERRTEVHQEEKRRVIELSNDMIVRHLWDAFHTNRPDRVMVLIKRGGDPNEESPRGLTPLLCLIMCESTVEMVEELVNLKADINKVNSFGITPLMLACKLKLTKIVHVLMRLGASIMQPGSKVSKRNTALHWCAIHGSEEEAKIMVDHVRDSAGDALRVSRCLDAPNDDGETALMLAALARNGIMCRLLVSMGAATSCRSKQGRTAAYIARHAGWTELADWLDTKLGSGVARVESFSDINYDKKIRYGSIKLRDLLLDFGKNYLILTQKRTGKHPLMPPSILQQYVSEEGQGLVDKIQKFTDRHTLIVNQKDEYNREALREDNNPAVALYKTMKASLNEMLDFISKGQCAPNFDCATNPMSVTPLICAAIIGDSRAMKLLVREGAFIDGQNKYGTTPLMFAAQLNNIEACIELLTLGASLTKQDHFGFTPLAYANSLPAPAAMRRNAVGVLMNDDVDGVKPFTAADVIKAATEGGVSELKAMVELNAAQSHPETIALHHRVLRLLEQYGLTRVDTENQVAVATYTTQWRLPEDKSIKETKGGKKDDDNSTEDSNHDTAASEESHEDDDYSLRCPMCTLMLPCAHFFKGAVLRRYFQRMKEQQEAAAKGLTGAALDTTNTSKRKKSPKRLQGLKARDKSKEVLEETGLADRETDRSFTLATKYRARELEIVREREAREAARIEAEQKEKLKAYAIARGVWVEWKESYNSNGELVIEHQDSHEQWTRYFDRHGNAYYYNAATQESRWIAPNKKPSAPPVPPASALPTRLAIEAGPARGSSPSPTRAKSPNQAASPSQSQSKSQSLSSSLVSASVSASAASGAAASLSQSPTAPAHESKLQVDAPSLSSKAAGPGTSSPSPTPITSTTASTTATTTSENKVSKQESKVSTKSLPELSISPLTIAAVSSSSMSISSSEPSGDELALTSTGPKSILKLDTNSNSRSRSKKNVHFNLPGELNPLSSGPLNPTPIPIPTPKPTIADAARNKTINLTPIELLSMTDEQVQAIEDRLQMATEPAAEVVPAKEQIVVVQSPATEEELPPTPSDTVATEGIIPLELAPAPSQQVVPLPPRSPLKKSELIGENPVPIASRRILLFSSDSADTGSEWDSITATHHYNVSPIVHSLPKTSMSHDQAEQLIAEHSNSEAFDLLDKPIEALNLAPVSLSGWLFVGLSVSKPGPPPIEYIQISLTMWAKVLEHLKHRFSNDWLPRMKLEPAVDLSRAEARANKRCTVCQTGFIRLIDDGNTDKDEMVELCLCLQCCMRKAMFELIKPTLPKSFEEHNPMNWPFDERFVKRFSAEVAAKKQFLMPVSINLKGLSGKATSAKGTSRKDEQSSSVKLRSTSENASSSSSKGTVEALLEASVAAAASARGKKGRPSSGGSSSKDPSSNDSGSSSTMDSGRIIESPRKLREQERPNGRLRSPTTAIDSIQQCAGMSPRKDPNGGKVKQQQSPQQQHRHHHEIAINELDTLQPKARRIIDRWDGAIDWFKKFEELQDSDDTQFALGRGAGVRDLPLLPYLVAKGHLEDLERTIRACYNQAGAEDSLQILPRLLCMQAEAYKLLGLWPLGLAVLLDRADMLATMTGYENVATINAVCHVTSCLRKMGYGHLTSSYLKSIIRRLEQKYENQMLGSDNAHSWKELGKDILAADEKRIIEKKKLDKFWKQSIDEFRPTREIRRRAYQSLGLGGLYKIMSSTTGPCIAIRLAFEYHCLQVDEYGLGKFATFVSSCMQLRSCDDWEVFQYLLHEILHKQLANSLCGKSEVARLYLDVTPYEYQASLSLFLKCGTPVEAHCLDPLLLASFKALTPEFSKFYRSHNGSHLFRIHLPDMFREITSVAAVLIQARWRVKKAMKRIHLRKRALADQHKAKLKAEEEDDLNY